MLYLEYDATRGKAYKDGECDDVVEEWAKDLEDGGYTWNAQGGSPDDPLMFSTANVFTALRVAVKRGRISADEISVEFEGKFLELDSDGRMIDWPNGFCDHNHNWLLQLL